MTSDDSFVPVFNEACGILGLLPPQIEQSESADLDLGRDFLVSVIALRAMDFIYIVAPICLLDNLNTRAFYRRALEANYMLSETSGATLGIDEHSHQMVLCARFRLQTLTGAMLADELLRLAAVAERLRNDLPSVMTEDASPGMEGLALGPENIVFG